MVISTIYQQYQEDLDIVSATKNTFALAMLTSFLYLKYKTERAAQERNEMLNERAQQIVQDVVLERLNQPNLNERNEIDNPR